MPSFAALSEGSYHQCIINRMKSNLTLLISHSILHSCSELLRTFTMAPTGNKEYLLRVSLLNGYLFAASNLTWAVFWFIHSILPILSIIYKKDVYDYETTESTNAKKHYLFHTRLPIPMFLLHCSQVVDSDSNLHQISISQWAVKC